MKKFLYGLFLILCLGLFTGAEFTGRWGISCDSGTNEVGFRLVASNDLNSETDYIYCWAATADCSGDLRYAYIYHRAAVEETCRIALYLDDGDNTPDADDTIVGTETGDVVANNTGWYTDSSDLTGTVTTGTDYWICVSPQGANFRMYYDTPGIPRWYNNCVGCGSNMPDTLPDGFANNQNVSSGIYIEVE